MIVISFPSRGEGVAVLYEHIYLLIKLHLTLSVTFRRPTLYVIPRDHMRQTGYAEICSEQRNNFLAFINQIKPTDLPPEIESPFQDSLVVQDLCKDDSISNSQEQKMLVETFEDVDTVSNIQVHVVPAPEISGDAQEAVKAADTNSNSQVDIMPAQEAVEAVITNSNGQVYLVPAQEDIKAAVTNSNCEVDLLPAQEALKDADTLSNSQVHVMPTQEVSREADTISISQERKISVVKIRVKQTTASNRSEKVDNLAPERSQAGHNEIDPVVSSSVSVDAPQRNLTEAVSLSNQMTEEVNSCQGRGSHMTASIGSAKIARGEGDEFGKELLCTADSSNIPELQQLLCTADSSNIPALKQPDVCLSPKNIDEHNLLKKEVQKPILGQTLSVAADDVDVVSHSTGNPESRGKRKEKKKDREKKRKRDDPEYLERKRLKKEKKQKEKERAKLLEEKNVVSGDDRSRIASEKRFFNNDRMAMSTVSMAKNDSVQNRLLDQEIPLEPILSSRDEYEHREATVRFKTNELNGPKLVLKTSDSKPGAPSGGSGHKLRIKIKTRK